MRIPLGLTFFTLTSPAQRGTRQGQNWLGYSAELGKGNFLLRLRARLQSAWETAL